MTQARAASYGAPLSLPAILAFACTSIPISALILAVAVHLPRYFASHLGMSLAVVGGAFALVRAIDIPLDMGVRGDVAKTQVAVVFVELQQMLSDLGTVALSQRAYRHDHVGVRLLRTVGGHTAVPA